MTRVLVIAPHADDETLGMGATIARMARAGDEVTVAVMTGHGGNHPLFSADQFEVIRAEARRACDLLGARLHTEELPTTMLSRLPVYEVNGAVARVVADVRPEAVYIPFLHDLHNDHGALGYGALVATRFYLNSGVKVLAMYETPTETHLMPGSLAPSFVPNRFVDVSDTFDAKLAAWDCYRSQHQAGFTPRSPDALRALACWRGASIGVRYAEAFQVLHETI